MPTSSLCALDIEPKEKLLGDFFEEADFGFIYAARGLGKTWLSLAIADGIVTAGGVGEWGAGSRGRRVLIVDGEMSLSESKMRAEAFNVSGEIEWLHHEQRFQTTENMLNTTVPEQQDALVQICQERGIEAVIADNLSCLFYGIKENDADDWGEYVLPWILRMRRLGIAVVIVAPAGRNGEMRGTSKREDQAHWVIKLKQSATEGDGDGARFVTSFTKNRHSPENRSPSLLWEFSPTPGGRTEIHCQAYTGYDAFLEMVRGGVDLQHDIADALGVNKATVSKWASKAANHGRIEKDGRRLKWVG